jgi:sterol O-acyltransferase
MQSGEPLTADQMQTFQRIIEEEIAVLDKELKGKAQSDEKSYPNNLTLGNFADWTILPTLVYELEYPRQERINWWYVLEKSMATFGTMCVMQVISQAYLYPPVAETVRMKEAGMSLEERAKQMPWIVSDMLFPLLLEQLLSWYVIWVSYNKADL